MLWTVLGSIVQHHPTCRNIQTHLAWQDRSVIIVAVGEAQRLQRHWVRLWATRRDNLTNKKKAYSMNQMQNKISMFSIGQVQRNPTVNSASKMINKMKSKRRRLPPSPLLIVFRSRVEETIPLNSSLIRKKAKGTITQALWQSIARDSANTYDLNRTWTLSRPISANQKCQASSDRIISRKRARSRVHLSVWSTGWTGNCAAEHKKHRIPSRIKNNHFNASLRHHKTWIAKIKSSRLPRPGRAMLILPLSVSLKLNDEVQYHQRASTRLLNDSF